MSARAKVDTNVGQEWEGEGLKLEVNLEEAPVPPGTVDSLMQKLEEALVDSATHSDRWMAPEGIQDGLTVGDLRDLRCILMALRSSLEWGRPQHREAAEKAAAKKNGKPRLRKVDGGKARAA